MNEMWTGFVKGCDWLEKLAIGMTAIGLLFGVLSFNIVSVVVSIPVAVALARLAKLRGQALGTGPQPVAEVGGTVAPPPPVRNEPPEGGWY